MTPGADGGWQSAPRWFLALTAAAACQPALSSAAIKPYDEGPIPCGVAPHGNVPYRDVWPMYGTASFHVPGTLDAIFDESVVLVLFAGTHLAWLRGAGASP